MSVVKNSKYGWLISHENLIKEIYKQVDGIQGSFQLKPELFKIISAYKTTKIKKKTTESDPFEEEVQHVKQLYKLIFEEIRDFFTTSNFEVRNTDALQIAAEIYTKSGENLANDLYGTNPDIPMLKSIQNNQYFFPKNCKFYSKDITELSHHLKDNKYDLILLDPPWWNKYIRRKRKHTDHAYDMMYNNQLKEIPLENHLSKEGLVVVWCTNSPQHLKALKEEIFPKWGLQYLGKWYWVKVTRSGEVVCPFSKPPRKQPFEQIIFGGVRSRTRENPPFDKLVVSVPSALHSHKPPLIKLLEPFLSSDSACLELFARYLLPQWTSYGKEVLRLQHEYLFTKIES